MALASAGPPEAVELEPLEPLEPDEPKGNSPEPKGEVPEPKEGTVVGGVDPPELVRQAARPTPNPAAMAIRTTSTTATTVCPQRRLGCGVVVVTQ
jgi:hypothetical protein